MKIGEFFCSHFNIEDGKNRQHFGILCFYFKKGKNTTEMQKKICVVYGKVAVTDRMCQKWFVKFHGIIDILANQLCCGAVLCIGRCLASPLASTH